MNKILFKCAILASVFMIVLGCTNSGTSSEKGNAESETSNASKENRKDSSTEKDNVKTIRTFLKLELTGPNKEAKKALKQLDQSSNPTLLKAYYKKYYQPLIAKEYFQDFYKGRYELFFLRPAYGEGYQLKPINIEIKKTEDDTYNWKAKVEYTKDGETKTSMINGLISLNDNGKIKRVKFVGDSNGLWKDLHPDLKEKAS